MIQVGGVTLCAKGVERWLPEVVDRVLRQRQHAGPVSVNAYITPPNGEGLRGHADPYDIMVVQLIGSKDWTVDGVALRSEAGGEFLLPAGVPHSTKAGPEGSVHLAVGFREA